MRTISIIVLLLAISAVVAGVLIEGTTEPPVNLFIFYMLATAALDLARRRHNLWFRLGVVPCIVGLSAGGVAQTLGTAHVASNVTMLVWVGVAVAVVASVQAISPKAREAGLLAS